MQHGWVRAILRLVEPTADSLSFPRRKRRSALRSVAYRSQPLLRKGFGTDRALRMLLNVERVAWRLAYETAGKQYGESFHNESLALTPTRLADWVPSQATVLDIGCGSGRIARELAARAQSVLGIDYDEAAIRAAQMIEHPPHVRFEVGDAHELDPETKYDVVMLVHVLEHIDDPHDLLASIGRLAPTLIVEVPAFDRCVLNPVRLDLGLDFSSDDDHVREYTKQLLSEQLEAAAWTVTEWARSPMSFAALATHTC
jgi:SAM-dependent methyltransferase